jgi:hypothetical protein
MGKASEALKAVRRVERGEEEFKAAAEEAPKRREPAGDTNDGALSDESATNQPTAQCSESDDDEALSDAALVSLEATLASEGQLRKDLASEANRSLSILSSLFGTAPATAKLAVKFAVARGEEPPTERPSTAPLKTSRFSTSERFRGEEAKDAPPSIAVGLKQAPEEAPSSSADLTSLKSIFHGDWASRPPEFGFAAHENPATLAGFKAMAERATVTQSHSFAFSFQDESPPTEAPTEVDAHLENIIGLFPTNLFVHLWGSFGRFQARPAMLRRFPPHPHFTCPCGEASYRWQQRRVGFLRTRRLPRTGKSSGASYCKTPSASIARSCKARWARKAPGKPHGSLSRYEYI